MNWKKDIESFLGNIKGEKTDIISFSQIGGGSINNTYLINTGKGDYFIKMNDVDLYPLMFEKETTGLRLLKKQGIFYVPEVIGTGVVENMAFLILEYIPGGVPDKSFWKTFGKQLAALHNINEDNFGFEEYNYIGSLEQKNNWNERWSEFFIEMRLQPLLKTAFNSHLLEKKDLLHFESFYKKVSEIFPEEKPSLLHGDLWSGNYISMRGSVPVLIDPAVYYGHREMDIAMSKLFGGFDQLFYSAYNDVYPLEKGWEKRIDYCNLYPLLVHVNLFGGSYVSSVRNIIKSF